MLPLLLAAFAATPPELLANGAFDKGLDGWTPNAPAGVTFDTAEVEGRRVARLRVAPDSPAKYPCLCQSIKVAPGDLLEAKADVSGRDIRDGYGAYICIEFHDAKGERLSYGQSMPAAHDGAWTPLVARTAAPDGAVTGRLCLLVNGHGEGLFRAARMARLDNIAPKPLNGPVTISVTNDVVCPSYIGFGVEDDGWFYNEENASHGVNAEDIALREGRIEWMRPATVRMFCWYKDWNPSGDWETFTFDDQNMKSHYRTLDLYQRLGARVNITGVEWGVPDPYGGDPAKFAKANGALFEHLIKDKGYTCIRDWTLTNEPNGYFAQKPYSFDLYTALHRAVAEEFKRRGLRVNVIGSDDTDGFPWFKQCVTTDAYYQTAEFFGSHRYFPYADRELARFFYDDRLSLLAEKTPRKPLVVGEFGFQDQRSGTMENPIMETYPYAVWTSAFCIDGLNHGVAGYSIWCLHEMYYPGNGFMNYGLWNYKNRGWQVRPVYHAWANFCRLTRPGDPVRRCDSSQPDHVVGAVVGNALFWVNKGAESAEVHIEGLDAKEVKVMTESTLHGDRDCGETVKLEQGRFTAPELSFGYLRSTE